MLGKLSCESNVIKYLLFLFNFLFALSGIAIIAAGCVVLLNIIDYTHFMEGRLTAPPIVLIVTGVVVFIIASLGCYGAIKENFFLLIIFAGLLLCIFVIELAVGIAAAVYKGQFQAAMKDTMNTSMAQYHNVKGERLAWDFVHTKMECCGVDGPKDWPENKRPYSCCHSVRENADPPADFHCQQAEPGDEILYDEGCYHMLKIKAEKNATILIGVGIGLAFIEIFGIIMACWLASRIKKKEAN